MNLSISLKKTINDDKESLQPTEKSTYISNSSDKYKGESKMNSNKKTARIVGVLFIAATVFSILGTLVFIGPILDDPDYLTNVSANENQHHPDIDP